MNHTDLIRPIDPQQKETVFVTTRRCRVIRLQYIDGDRNPSSDDDAVVMLDRAGKVIPRDQWPTFAPGEVIHAKLKITGAFIEGPSLVVEYPDDDNGC